MKTSQHKFIRNGILICSISFILIGIYLGEPVTIYSKAIRICLECIGIG